MQGTSETIDKVEVFILRAPLGKAKFWSSQSAFPERNSLLVKITAGGVSGWGEAGQYGPPEPTAAAIEHVLAPRIIGEKVQPTVVSELLYSFSRDFGQRGTYVEAISGIDIALWDLLGKLLKVPVCTLLGGAFRSRVKVYATGCYYRHDSDDPKTIDVDESVKAAALEASSFKEAGFKAVKIKVGLLCGKLWGQRLDSWLTPTMRIRSRPPSVLQNRWNNMTYVGSRSQLCLKILRATDEYKPRQQFLSLVENAVL